MKSTPTPTPTARPVLKAFFIALVAGLFAIPVYQFILISLIFMLSGDGGRPDFLRFLYDVIFELPNKLLHPFGASGLLGISLFWSSVSGIIIFFVTLNRFLKSSK